MRTRGFNAEVVVFSRKLVSIPYSSQYLSGGVILGVADDLDAAPKRDDLVTLGNGLASVISSLGLDVGTNLPDESAHVRLAEDHDRVHTFESGNNFGALALRHGRTRGTLQPAYALVRIDGNDELSAEFAGTPQVADMAHVQEVKAAVCKGHTLACGTPLGDQFGKFSAIDDSSHADPVSLPEPRAVRRG